MIKKIRKNWRKFLRIFETRTGSRIVFFTDSIVRRYAYCHKELQAIIAIVSNYRAGINVESQDFHPRAIYKAEGGVNVDDKEIVIKRNRGIIVCYNDWDDKETVTPKIVKEVIEEILSIENPDPLCIENVLIEYAVKNTNVPEKILREKISRFVANPFAGNSLVRLFSS